MRAAGWDVCVVVDEDRVVLGVIREDAAGADPAAPVDQVMEAGPATLRPDVVAGKLPDYLRRRGYRLLK